QGAEQQRLVAQLPDHPQGPAPAEQVEQRHDRRAGRRAAHGAAGPGDLGALVLHGLAPRKSKRYRAAKIEAGSLLMPRIAPLEPPYPPDIEAALAKWMPPGSPMEPLRLFRTLVVH